MKPDEVASDARADLGDRTLLELAPDKSLLAGLAGLQPLDDEFGLIVDPEPDTAGV